MNQEVPHPTTATRSPGRGIAARLEVFASAARATARRQQSGWVAISISVWLMGLRPLDSIRFCQCCRS